MPFFYSQDLINGTKTENGVLKKTFGRGLVQVLAMKKIIIDQLGRKRLRALLVMEGQMCQAPRVVVQGTLGLAIDCETLL